jgi:1,4-alpha-glucan branching enzyme
VIHANGAPANSARIFGVKFLREWTRTLRLTKPNVFLIAEDHSGWTAVTHPSDQGGLGFDAVWYAEYYHHLIGDAQNNTSRARLLKMAGYGDSRPLAMSWFAGALANSASGKVVYHESHDEAGNSYYVENGQEVHSARTIVVAVNGVPLKSETRRYAEARVHFAAGVTLLGPGIPMFFMGEEAGASEPYRYDDFINHRENFPALRQGVSAALFRFYQDLIRLRSTHPAVRSHNIDVVYTHDTNRMLAFRRWDESEELLIIANLNNHPFRSGYTIENLRVSGGFWREIFNSDLECYGGNNIGNFRAVIPITSGDISIVIPANGFVVLRKELQ